MAKKPQPRRIPPFNPLNKTNLGESVAKALLTERVGPLRPEPFIGAGIYALYYVGSFPAYAEIAELLKVGNPNLERVSSTHRKAGDRRIFDMRTQ